MVFSPVRLQEDAVDLVEADDLLAVSDGFEHGGETEVADPPEDALGGADDQGDGVFAEGVVAEADDVELGIEEGLQVVGIEPGDTDGIGDAALDVLIDGQVQLVHELGLGEEDQVMILGGMLSRILCIYFFEFRFIAFLEETDPVMKSA